VRTSIAEPCGAPASRANDPVLDLNAVVAYNVRAIRDLRRLTQEDVAERLAAFTGHRLPQASISNMERSFDSERRRLFDAHLLYLLSKVFDVPIIYFFLPPPTCLNHAVAGTNERVGTLLDSVLGRSESLCVVDKRLVEIARPTEDASKPTDRPGPGGGIARWRDDLIRLSEVDCHARLREIAELLRDLADSHGPSCA
jgi:transcriptional regulator with XRE-family HTH domain